MPRPPRKRIWQPVSRRLPPSLMLLAYCTATFGFPLPARSQKEASQPFPCQDHPCGCQSAEQCWRGCCCFTPEQRFAWAAEHHVEPPAYAERPAAEGWRTTPLRSQDEDASTPPEHGACCKQSAGKTSSTPSASKTCCGNEGTVACCQHQKPRSSEKVPPTRPSFSWALGLSAAKCQGMHTLWITTGAALPLPEAVSWNPNLVPVARSLTSEATAFRVALPPLTPPPRPFCS
jgi:hypothetical protein